ASLNRRHRSASAGLPVSAVASSPQFLQTATTMSKIAAGARRDSCREITGFAVQCVVAAVGGIEPPNLGSGNLGPIGIDGGFIEIDRNLPGRAARLIGAGDPSLALLRVARDRRSEPTNRRSRNYCR